MVRRKSILEAVKPLTPKSPIQRKINIVRHTTEQQQQQQPPDVMHPQHPQMPQAVSYPMPAYDQPPPQPQVQSFGLPVRAGALAPMTSTQRTVLISPSGSQGSATSPASGDSSAPNRSKKVVIRTRAAEAAPASSVAAPTARLQQQQPEQYDSLSSHQAQPDVSVPIEPTPQQSPDVFSNMYAARLQQSPHLASVSTASPRTQARQRVPSVRAKTVTRAPSNALSTAGSTNTRQSASYQFTPQGTAQATEQTSPSHRKTAVQLQQLASGSTSPSAADASPVAFTARKLNSPTSPKQ